MNNPSVNRGFIVVINAEYPIEIPIHETSLRILESFSEEPIFVTLLFMTKRVISTPGSGNQSEGIFTVKQLLIWTFLLATGAAHADTPALSTQQTLRLSGRVGNDFLSTKRFQHFYRGLEVVGSERLEHSSAKGSLVSDEMARFDLSTAARLSEEEAIRIAHTRAPGKAQSALKILPREDRVSADLVYFIHLGGDTPEPGRQILVHAQDGHLIADIPDEETLAPVTVYSAKGKGEFVSLMGVTSLDELDPKLADDCQLWDDTGAPFWINPNGCTPIIVNSKAVHKADVTERRAAAQAQKVLAYYQRVHHRDSYDGNGSTVISVVHAGQSYDNALWDRQKNQMAYGDGDGKMFGDFTKALDVIGHEFTHGVTAATAKLLAMGESGALNEAYSDFFGKMIANDGDWAMGRKAFVNPSKAKGFRNLADPASMNFRLATREGKYPAKLSEEIIPAAQEPCVEMNDECYVHVNSTIASHAAYLVVQKIGKSAAEQLYYTTLTQKLTATSTLKSAAQSTVETCALMFDQKTCSEVADALLEAGFDARLPALQ